MSYLFTSCPKTVENFCVHVSNGYYNNHIFHRVIKSFMIQTGDPTGNEERGRERERWDDMENGVD